MRKALFPATLLGLLAASGAVGWIAGKSDTSGEHHVVFGLCPTGGEENCVVDGDTAWLDGQKIRLADIDTPETSEPRCPAERTLGNRATVRLQQLVNAGPFTVKQAGGRDKDRFGRKLRVFTRNGQSLGDVLVNEGLARRWTGKREPWC